MQEPDIDSGSQLRRDILTGEAEYEVAIAEVIARAENTLHIFDTNLALGGYAGLQRSEALRNFLLRSGKNRLVVVLHETDFLTARCPRLMQLLRIHSHAISIHKTQEHAQVASDPFVIADEKHYVHRFHRDGARLLLALHDPSGAKELEGRFQQLLEASCPAVFATTLGL
jgi:hypothetical protein